MGNVYFNRATLYNATMNNRTHFDDLIVMLMNEKPKGCWIWPGKPLPHGT